MEMMMFGSGGDQGIRRGVPSPACNGAAGVAALITPAA
jgi:hypothetical protein